MRHSLMLFLVISQTYTHMCLCALKIWVRRVLDRSRRRSYAALSKVLQEGSIEPFGIADSLKAFHHTVNLPLYYSTTVLLLREWLFYVYSGKQIPPPPIISWTHFMLTTYSYLKYPDLRKTIMILVYYDYHYIWMYYICSWLLYINTCLP